LRKTRFILVVALIAVLGIAATAAYAATTIDTSGSVSATGGSKKKPKSGGLKFGFTVTDPSGTQPAPLKDYSIAFEGGRMNLQIMKSCSAAKINAANQGDDSVCPKGSKIGAGSLDVAVGATGDAVANAIPCKASLTLYAAGKGHASLFVESTLANCPAAVHQAIDMKYFTKNGASGLSFEVPNELRHQIGLDLTVVKTDVTIPKVVKKKGKKKVGLLESTGCTDGQRDLVVTFTDEKGAAFPITKTLGKC
jgi:hypothetical protein